MEETLGDRNGGSRSWNGPWEYSMGQNMISAANILARIIISLCLAAVCVAVMECDVVVKVDSTGVNPSSFTAQSENPVGLRNLICLYGQDGELLKIQLDSWAIVYNTLDYNVSLFTRSGECKVLDQRVDKRTGKTITDYECSYKNAEEHRSCAFFTKPNSRREGKRYLVYSRNENRSHRSMIISGPNGEETVNLDPFSSYELKLSKYLPGSSVKLFIEIGWKYPTKPDEWMLVDIEEDKSYTVNDKTRGEPKNGDLGDFQVEEIWRFRRNCVKYSDPVIKCGYLDEFSCKCTVQEQSMVSYIESHKSKLEKPGKVLPFGSDMASELIAAPKGQTHDIDMRLRLAT